ncbi:Holotricin-3 precursor [Brucella cytisi]|uniref:Holotricin-3 precursor n=1 Tax=Brucella cytisi TaxID=407152 RepID=UPI0035E109B5
MSIGRKIGAVGISAGLAVSLSLLPVLTDTNHADTAYAKGEGGGNGGGNGGVHGGGNGSGNGGNKDGNSSHSGMRDSHRSSAARSSHHRADPITKSGVTRASVTKDKNTLGPLNAAHASATARANAAPNSSVGRIASYEQARDRALSISDPIKREEALDEAKDQLETAFNRTISEKEFQQIDNMLEK